MTALKASGGSGEGGRGIGEEDLKSWVQEKSHLHPHSGRDCWLVEDVEFQTIEGGAESLRTLVAGQGEPSEECTLGHYSTKHPKLLAQCE